MTSNVQTQTATKIVWVISDGIAGHYNQSKGVLKALELLHPIDTNWVDLRLRGGWLRLVLSTLLNLFGIKLPLKYLSWFYKNVDLPSQTPDIIVGTGGKISFAVVWLAGFYGAKSIFCGSVRRLKPSLFSAVLTVEPETAPPYLVLETYPTHIRLRRPVKSAFLKETSADGLPLWALLIGGNRDGIVYTQADWNVLANQINATASTQNIRWLITSSRRTGFEVEQILASLIQPELIEDVVWSSQDNRPVIQDYMNRAAVVVCTADSHSMLTESIVAQRPVIAVHPNTFAPDTEYMGMLQRYVHSKRIKLVNVRDASLAAEQRGEIVPLTVDMTVQLAGALAAHFNFSPQSETHFVIPLDPDTPSQLASHGES